MSEPLDLDALAAQATTWGLASAEPVLALIERVRELEAQAAVATRLYDKPEYIAALARMDAHEKCDLERMAAEADRDRAVAEALEHAAQVIEGADASYFGDRPEAPWDLFTRPHAAEIVRGLIPNGGTDV